MRRGHWLRLALLGIVLLPLLVLSACWWLLFDYLPFRLKVHRVVRGGPHRAWRRLQRLWGEADAVYGSLVGPELATALENEAMEAFVHRYPDAEAVLAEGLRDESPSVCAYAVRALWRLKAVKGEFLTREHLPPELLGRTDPLVEWFGCRLSTTSLGEFVLRHLPEGAGRGT
jgi:hypothetical protein